jgi:glycosyltransferase involved in cell wall biosynthesis
VPAERKPRVLFVAHTAAVGGPTHSLLLLLRHLRERYDVGVLLPERGPLVDALTADNYRFRVLPDLRVTSVPEMIRWIRRQRIDLVYGNNPSRRARNALIAARLAGRPYVWHFRGMKWHWGWRDGIALRWADAVVAVSSACADSIRRFCPANRLHVVYNGVDDPPVVDRADARRYVEQTLGIARETRVILSVGHVMERKGHQYAIEAMALVARHAADVRLVIAGALDREAECTKRVQELVRRRELENRVHLLGLRDDLPRWLAAADVLLHTALQDPHPRAVLEGMAAGLPVVAFSVDGVSETVVHGECGWLVPAGDAGALAAALRLLLDRPESSRAFGRAARERVVRHFSAATTAASIGAIIDDVLARRVKGSGVTALVHETRH